ncbi:MAG: hypothetical protein WKF58_16605 [Ilumatobacteraceae bacterium]
MPTPAGKIPGSFFRREGRPTEDAILTCRLTDRPLRPAFAKGFRNETQVVITVIGADQVNPHDVLSINAASAALMISGIPFDGPIGAVKLAYTPSRRVDHPSDVRADRRSHVRARRRRPRARRRRHRRDDGRGRRHREELHVLRRWRPEGRRGRPRQRARGLQAGHQGFDRHAAPARCERHLDATVPSRRSSSHPSWTTATTCSPQWRRSVSDQIAQAVTISAKARAQRGHRTPPPTPPSPRCAAPRTRPATSSGVTRRSARRCAR